MLKTIIGGITVGIANVIPGVSGGTMMVVLGIFNKVTDSISKVFEKDNPNRMKNIMFLAQVLFGAAIGLVGFAKIITFLFENYPTQTYWWFIGLVACSIPVFLKTEAKGEKIHWIWLVLGMLVIFIIGYFTPEDAGNISPKLPSISIGLLIQQIFIGAIAGGTMLLPGVSGSMILLIIGQYHIFKTYLATVTSFQLDVLIPLGFMGVGILIGIIIAAKLCSYFMKNYKRHTISFLLGLIIASSLVLIPLHADYNLFVVFTSALSAVFGGVIVLGIEKLS